MRKAVTLGYSLPMRRPLFAVFALLAACGFHPVPMARMYSAGVTIEAEDGSFRLVGEEVPTPFQTSCGGAMDNIDTSINLRRPAELINRARDGLELGGRRVKVVVPGEPQPLHGVLVLCNVPGSAEGIGARVYSVAVTPENIAAAKEGRIAVGIEQYQWPIAGSLFTYNTWILWLTKDPIP